MSCKEGVRSLFVDQCRILTRVYSTLIKSIRIEITDAVRFPVLLTTLYSALCPVSLLPERIGTVTETLRIMGNRKPDVIE